MQLPTCSHFTGFSSVFEHPHKSTLQLLKMAANVDVINRWLVSLAPWQMVTCFSTVWKDKEETWDQKGREKEEEEEKTEAEGGGC